MYFYPYSGYLKMAKEYKNEPCIYSSLEGAIQARDPALKAEELPVVCA